MKKDTDKMKYFIYRRKSSDDSKQVASLSVQKAELDLLVTRSGVEVIDEFEEAKTATK